MSQVCQGAGKPPPTPPHPSTHTLHSDPSSKCGSTQHSSLMQSCSVALHMRPSHLEVGDLNAWSGPAPWLGSLRGLPLGPNERTVLPGISGLTQSFSEGGFKTALFFSGDGMFLPAFCCPQASWGLGAFQIVPHQCVQLSRGRARSSASHTAVNKLALLVDKPRTQPSPPQEVPPSTSLSG